MIRVSMWAVLALLAVAPVAAFGQDIVLPAPTATYYPPVPIYATAPAVSYYSGPAPVISYYSGPGPVVTYASPSYYVAPAPYVTTYRYGLLGLRTATTSSYYPPVVAPVVYPAFRPRVAYYGPIYP